MVRLILSLMALTIFNVAGAQISNFNRHEISVNYGFPSILHIADRFDEPFYDPDNEDGYSGNSTFSGTISLGYNYRLTKMVGLGVAFVYEHSSCNILRDKPNPIGRSRSNYLSIIPVAKFNWVNKPIFTLYSKIGFGAQFEFRKQNFDNRSNKSNVYRYFAFQFSPVGIELGRKVSGFVELGVGQQGIAQLGVKYKF